MAVVQALLGASADVDKAKSHGCTPLIQAARSRHGTAGTRNVGVSTRGLYIKKNSVIMYL